MNEVKKKLAEAIKKAVELLYNLTCSIEEIEEKIEVPKNEEMGDLAFPCFHFSKQLKKSPMILASEIASGIQVDHQLFSSITSVSGYVNCSINGNEYGKQVVKQVLIEKEKYGFVNEGNQACITVDYSSPNIAKPFHLGHFRTTIIGRALVNLYQELGYHVVSINHLGDWGRQFGLLIEGYRRFKQEYTIELDPLHTLSDIYVRINTLAKQDEHIFEIARENFKKLEQGDPELLNLWQYFKDISLKEYDRIYKLMGCKFDSYYGEAFYNDKMEEVVDILDKKGVLVDSEGAKVVFVGENEPPCIILKSNGSTIYATRDLAAILYRVRTYNFVKNIYVTSYEQLHHFKQVFEVAKYIVEEKYSKGLVHVPYGMVRLSTGKMSTREGTVIYLQDLITDAISKSRAIIEEKSKEIQDKELLARQIGIGALVFNDLKHNKIKDNVFDLDEVLRFDGETGPYIQYTAVRIQSLLKKADVDISTISLEQYEYNEQEIKLIKLIAKLSDTIKQAAQEYEPSVLARYLLEVASCYSTFYNNNNIMEEEIKIKEARIALSYATLKVLKKGLGILGIECPERM